MQATESALGLLSALFEMDQAFVNEQLQKPNQGPAVATLDALLMRNPAWVIQLVQYASYPEHLDFVGLLLLKDCPFPL